MFTPSVGNNNNILATLFQLSGNLEPESPASIALQARLSTLLGGLGGASGVDSFSSNPLSLLLGGSGGGSGLEAFLPMLMQSQGLNIPGAANLTSGSDAKTAEAKAKSTISIGEGDPYLVEDYANARNADGTVNQDKMKKRYTDMGASDTEATRAARVNTVQQLAREYKNGSRIEGNRSSEDAAAKVKLDRKDDGDRAAMILASYKQAGGTLKVADLKTLLENSDNRDLAKKDGVGTDEFKTIAAIQDAINRGSLELRQVFNGEGDNKYVNDTALFEKSAKYVDGGGLGADVKDLEKGVKDDNKDLIKRVSAGVNAETIRTESSGNGSSSGGSTGGSGNIGDTLREMLNKFLPILILSQIFNSLFGGQSGGGLGGGISMMGDSMGAFGGHNALGNPSSDPFGIYSQNNNILGSLGI